ncbi:hypothetical protein [Leyella stercorea]|uniref:hypothetical protein n=1 Tax=Leyella stercorea TaxID=363265 RepID=UPI00242F7E01|nr:hypothetical protein [Leyella stercorea]
MSMIVPNSDVYILKNVPLEPSFDHTIWFDSPEQQATAFTTYALAFYFDKVSYQRYPRPYITLDKTADDLFDCNYMMFRNTAYGTKWFYAFITQVEYISNTTSRIYYSIDPMQTYLFDVNVDQCWVEREHAMTDAIGDNLIPESFELGEYVFDADYFPQIFEKSHYTICILATWKATYKDNKWVIEDASSGGVGGVDSGIYTGLTKNTFDYDPDNPQSAPHNANAVIEAATKANKADGIVSITMYPKFFMNWSITGDLADGLVPYKMNGIPAFTGTFDGYKPKNNKLYTSPFCGVYVDNLQGNAANYAYEYFTDRKPLFYIVGASNGNLECSSVPINYKGLPSNYQEAMIMGGFPQCAWNVDTFKAWIAQNKYAIAAGVATTAIDTVKTVALAAAGLGAAGEAVGMASITTGAGSAKTAQAAAQYDKAYQNMQNVAYNAQGDVLNKTINLVAQVKTASTQPNHSRGQQSSSIYCAMGVQGFHYMPYRIQGQFARVIDDFFSMFGYKTNRLKVPNRNGRKAWNYVKTCGCTLTGSAPADVTAALVQIYDRGITFWRCIDLSAGNPFTRVGNYSLDNSL